MTEGGLLMWVSSLAIMKNEWSDQQKKSIRKREVPIMKTDG
jgi:hypothetical protein